MKQCWHCLVSKSIVESKRQGWFHGYAFAIVLFGHICVKVRGNSARHVVRLAEEFDALKICYVQEKVLIGSAEVVCTMICEPCATTLYLGVCCCIVIA